MQSVEKSTEKRCIYLAFGSWADTFGLLEEGIVLLVADVVGAFVDTVVLEDDFLEEVVMALRCTSRTRTVSKADGSLSFFTEVTVVTVPGG